MTIIELPDHEAAALKAKAAAQGLTLEAWLKHLAEEDLPATTLTSAQSAVAQILQVQRRVKPDPDGWTVRDYISSGRL